MKSLIKYWPLTAISIIVAGIFLWRSCSQEHVESIVTVPSDTTFMPVEKKTYTPPTVRIPGLRRPESSHSPELPKGVNERDVARIVKLEVQNSNRSIISIIETKDGMVYVAKDPGIRQVEVITYNPPFAGFGVFPGVGISFAPFCAHVGDVTANNGQLSPMLKVSFVEIVGFARLPMLAVDTRSFGFGAECKIYHDVYAGAGVFVPFSDMRQRVFKLTLLYNF